ncbi:MAG: patatin-like phospholipase family protein [Leptolyngbyaceae cyanobacterium RM1_405_57]|nr:patatin-like phospholipase family protein [Leptolyngbyaceae cyanobacterium RM1_405_57]
MSVKQPNTGAVVGIASYFTRSAVPTFSEWIVDFLEVTGIIENTKCIFDPRPIENFLREAVVPEQLRNGIELWVAAFPSLQIPGIDYDILMAAIDLFRARMGTKAHWLRVQDCGDDETLYTLLLASAAIPLAF